MKYEVTLPDEESLDLLVASLKGLVQTVLTIERTENGVTSTTKSSIVTSVHLQHSSETPSVTFALSTPFELLSNNTDTIKVSLKPSS